MIYNHNTSTTSSSSFSNGNKLKKKKKNYNKKNDLMMMRFQQLVLFRSKCCSILTVLVILSASMIGTKLGSGAGTAGADAIAIPSNNHYPSSSLVVSVGSGIRSSRTTTTTTTITRASTTIQELRTTAGGGTTTIRNRFNFSSSHTALHALRGGASSAGLSSTTTTSTTSSTKLQESKSSDNANNKDNITTTKSSNNNSSKLREAVFPIYGKEVKKFFLMGSIKFFIIMALTLTRDTKDTMVVTQCGAEAIAFLKIYGVLPAATSFIAIYSKMSSILEKRTLFYTTCIPFFLFFFIFDAVIFPNRLLIQPSIVTVQRIIGGQNGGAAEILSKIISNWTSALYFVVAELYSSASVGILFWQFANDVVPVEQAKRFYPLFSQMGGVAPILAGQYVACYASKAIDFQGSLHRLTGAVSVAGVMICLFYHLSTSHLQKKDDDDDNKSPIALSESTTTTAPKKKKSEMSMTDSMKFLASSQYLRLVGSLVLGYGLSINFTEIMWKSILKKKYPNPLDYQRFMGNFSSAVGLATCIVIFFGVHVIRVLGWRIGAIATPATMGLLSIPFFGCVLMGIDNPARLSLAVTIGTIQSLLSKTAKYALFDPTTQMAYIPLDEESKVKGKAAIDVLGSRLGKSGGSLIQQILVFCFGNIVSAGPAVAAIFYSVIFAWISAANKLSGLFIAKTEMNKAEEQGDK